MVKIVVVEDDVRVREAVTRSLAALGHDIETVATGMGAVEMVVGDPPNVVVLDLGLPDVDGREVLKMIRAVSDVPVIVATARDDEDEVVRVLDSGADDYIIKPYSAGQLDARVRAVLRRTSPSVGEGGPLLVGLLSIDPGARVVELDGTVIELTRKEFDLLAYLAERVGVVVTKRELLAEVWRQPYGGADKTVDVHLSWLRKKLGESASQPAYLHTVRGVGVKLVDPT